MGTVHPGLPPPALATAPRPANPGGALVAVCGIGIAVWLTFVLTIQLGERDQHRALVAETLPAGSCAATTADGTRQATLQWTVHDDPDAKRGEGRGGITLQASGPAIPPAWRAMLPHGNARQYPGLGRRAERQTRNGTDAAREIRKSGFRARPLSDAERDHPTGPPARLWLTRQRTVRTDEGLAWRGDGLLLIRWSADDTRLYHRSWTGPTAQGMRIPAGMGDPGWTEYPCTTEPTAQR